MEFKEHLRSYLSDKEIDDLLASLNEKDKHAVILNIEKMSEENFLSLFPNVKPHPLVNHAFLYDKSEYPLGEYIYHELGCYYLQEPSAMVVSSLIDFKEDDFVLDLCAAPGGKSVQAALKMHNKGLIISNDISHSRAELIKENAERMGLVNLLITSNDFSKISDFYQNKFDKIILDAPCSGSGMFRKNELMKNDWTYEKVIKCSALQKDLILMAYSLLKPGGLLSYSTCSFSKEEDEDIIDYLLSNSDAEIVPINVNPLLYSHNNKGVHLFPHLFPGEGHYICHIKKPGIIKANKSFDGDDFTSKSHQIKYGDFLFGVSENIIPSKLSIIRYGCKIGETIKDFIKYDIHYAHALKNFPNEIELNEKELEEYIKGLSIKKESPKGFLLLKFHNIAVDFAKSDGQVIKNHYPKYLRNKKLLIK